MKSYVRELSCTSTGGDAQKTAERGSGVALGGRSLGSGEPTEVKEWPRQTSEKMARARTLDQEQ